MSGQDDFRRFVRTVRKVIREDVRTTREIPGLSLWVSHQASPRRCAHVPIGAATSPFEVRANVRGATLEALSAYAAIGRALADAAPGSSGPILTTEFGLIVAGESRYEAWHAPIRAGVVGAWEEDTVDQAWAGDVPTLLAAALRDVASVVAKCEGCGGKADLVVCAVCGRGGRGS